jgi:hypothetical protein
MPRKYPKKKKISNSTQQQPKQNSAKIIANKKFQHALVHFFVSDFYPSFLLTSAELHDYNHEICSEKF